MMETNSRGSGISIRYESLEEWQALFEVLERIAGRKLSDDVGYIILVHPEVAHSLRGLRGEAIEIDVKELNKANTNSRGSGSTVTGRKP